MPATIRARCERCGPVEVPVFAARLSLTIDAEDLRREDLRNTVDFECPRCGAARRQQVDERGTRLLSSAGITVVALLSAPVDSAPNNPS